MKLLKLLLLLFTLAATISEGVLKIKAFKRIDANSTVQAGNIIKANCQSGFIRTRGRCRKIFR